jgi:DNA repair protein RadC
LVHPREVFRTAIRDAASSIILAHNHPSGDPTPSREDAAVTKRLEEVGRTVGIDILDHIVMGRDGIVSIRETE